MEGLPSLRRRRGREPSNSPTARARITPSLPGRGDGSRSLPGESNFRGRPLMPPVPSQTVNAPRCRLRSMQNNAQIAEMQASINKLQSMMEAMMGALAANGVMNPGMAPHSTPQPHQQQQVQQQQHQGAQDPTARPNWNEVTENEEAGLDSNL